MRLNTGILVVSLLFASFATQAVEPPQLEKLKTGILPSGGFYTVYAVACDDESTSHIVSSNRKTRWCTQSGEQLNCHRRLQAASLMACPGIDVADAAPTPLAQ